MNSHNAFLAAVLISALTATAAAQSPARDVVGVWQDRGTTLTLNANGTATQELHIPGHRNQRFTEPQQGTYTIQGNQLLFRWRASASLPARDDTCTFSTERAGLRLRCDQWQEAATYHALPERESSGLSGLVLQITVSAAILTLVLGAGLLATFRRRILALMKDSGAASEADRETGDEIWSASSAQTSHHLAQAQMSRMSRVYAIAGGCAIIPLVIGSALAYAGRVTPGLAVSLAVVFAWPVLIILKEVQAHDWRTFGRRASIYAVLLLAIGVALQQRNASFQVSQIVLMWSLINLIPTLFIILFANRTLRALAPALFGAAWLAMAGLWGLQHRAAIDLSVSRVLLRVVGALHLAETTWVPALFFMGFLIAVPAVWLLLRLLAAAWERRIISDLSLSMDAIFFLFCVLQATFSLGDESATRNLLWFTLSLPVWVLARLLMLRSSHQPLAAAQAPSLLILRVFRIEREPQRLFDELSHRWRFVGPVRLIAGVDLASRLIQPSTFWKFISGKLRDLFISSEDALQKRLIASRQPLDIDRRFRAYEFFCQDNIWLRAATLLAARSDVVVVDVRNFNASRRGVRQELQMLLRIVPASRIALIIDRSTNTNDLDNAEREAWEQAPPSSPNYRAAARSLCHIDIGAARHNDINHACDVIFSLTREQPGFATAA